MILYQSMYAIQDETRRAEIDAACHLNLNNPHIHRVVILAEDGLQLPSHPKLSLLEINRRPSFQQFFRIVNEYGKDTINIIANVDISFDDTIGLANRLTDDQAFAISRHDLRDGIYKIVVGGDSQDCWCFRGAVRGEFGDYKMGQRGCDNRLAYELSRADYRLSNPCWSIIIKHHHVTQERHYWDYVVPGPYLSVQQCGL
jgi:hypothetical protein